jgi:hypothetical protein
LPDGWFVFAEVVGPDNPFCKNNYIEEGAKDPVVGKMPVLWPVDDNDAEHDDPEDVNAMHDDDGCRDIPEFVFPGTRKKEKEDRDLKELLEAGTGFVDEKGGTSFTSRSRLRREVGITGLMADAR